MINKLKFACPECKSSLAFYTSRPLASHDNDLGSCPERDQVCKMKDWIVTEWND